MNTIIVTGSSGNLGKAVVEKFLATGWQVVGTTNRSRAATSQDNPAFDSVQVDLGNEAAAHDFVSRTISNHGPINAAVLTVGGFETGHLAETDVENIRQQYQLNFETAFNIAKPVFLHMVQQGKGRIFLVGARPGLSMQAGKGSIGYAFAKSLLFRLAELLNEEAKGLDVVTSVVVPSTIDTPQNRDAMPGADFTKWVQPEQIADIIYYYCSPEAAAIREPLIKIYGAA